MRPTDDLQPNEFPIGAALTVAYGNADRMFCNLGHLYRIVGAMTGQVPNPAGIDDAIDQCRDEVLHALPTEMQALDPPPADPDNESADVAWVAGIANKYGPTITLANTRIR